MIIDIIKFIEKYADKDLEHERRISCPLDIEDNVILSYFDVAIQNFANIICEKQRYSCLYSNSILNAEQPKINDL